MSDTECQVETVGDFVCGRQVIRDGKCIFHLENKTNEESKIFEREFWAEFERMKKDNDIKGIPCDNFIFPNQMTFSNTLEKFEKYISFAGAQFGKYSDFSGVDFESPASFFGAKFYGEANFSGAEFNDVADFSDVQFRKGANFFRS